MGRKHFLRSDGNLEILYVLFPWLISIGFIIYLFIIFIRAYIVTKIKYLMDIKYFSEYKLLMIYGLIGTLLYTIICTISTFKACGEFKVEYKKQIKELNDYLCGTQINGTKYFANFDHYFKTIKESKEYIFEIISVIIGALSFFFYKLFSIKIIKYLSPFHFILSISLFYLFGKLIFPVYNKIFGECHCFFKEEQKYKIFNTKYIFDIIGDILSIISFLIYLEIIELNFCGFNYYLKRNIISRASYEHRINDERINRIDISEYSDDEI